MKGIKDFIIQIENPYSETFKTENGVELYADKKFSAERLTNRIVKVVSTPFFHETPIKEGYELLIDPTILYKQTYQGVEQDYTNLVDEEKMWFKISPQMIVLFRKDKDSEWKGYLQNVLVEPIVIEQEILSKVILAPEKKKEYKKDVVKLTYSNEDLIKKGANNGDEITINPLGGIPFWVEGKEYWWLRNVDIFLVA